MYKRGFTIVELLVVIVVIAVLAAITVVAFNGVQRRAQTSAVSSSLGAAVKKIRLYHVDNNVYPPTLADAGISDSTTTYQYSSTANSYCVTGTQGSVSLYVSDAQSTPVAGGCAGHGQGGVAAITNLAMNPSAEGVGGWSANNGTTHGTGYDAALFRSGTRSRFSYLRAGQTSNAMFSCYSMGSTDGLGVPITKGGTYTISVYFRADVANRGQLSTAYRSGGVYSSVVYGTTITGSTTGWTRVSQTVTVPEGADRVRTSLAIMTQDGSGAVPDVKAYADDFMFVEGSMAPVYADGNTANWVWNGTPHGSTSTGPAL